SQSPERSASGRIPPPGTTVERLPSGRLSPDHKDEETAYFGQKPFATGYRPVAGRGGRGRFFPKNSPYPIPWAWRIASPCTVHRLAGPHHLDEAVEEVGRIVRARRGLGVVLDRKDRERPVAEAGQRSVVEVDVGHLAIDAFQRLGVDAEPVVLGGDFHPPGEH